MSPLDVDTSILLVLGIIVLLFIAYEIAGMTLPRFHTISFYAKHNRRLYRLILALFLIGGGIGAVWWRSHINAGDISK